MNQARIEVWWNDLRATIILKLQQWLCWWAKKSTRLAYYSLNKLELEEEALLPKTNLTESVCSSMLEMVAR